MGIIRQEFLGVGVLWGIWEIVEPLPELLALYPQAEADPDFTAIKVPQRRQQWIAGRLLVKKLLEIYGLPFPGIYKDEHKKVHLIDSHYHISIAHSDQWAVASVDLYNPTGIDIEKVTPRIRKVASKLLTPAEKEVVAPDDDLGLTVYWCAKEALYKLYGRKLLHFNQEIHVERRQDPRMFRGSIRKEGFYCEVELLEVHFGEYVIVGCL